MKRFFLIWALLTLSSFACVLSQDFIDTEGKDFHLTFLPNYHNNNDSDNPTDSLYIFISSNVPTKGTINYKSISGQQFTHNFNISDPKQIYTFVVSYFYFELNGFNNSGSLTATGQNERVARQSFHITSEEEVTVYALNQAALTSEAFLVLPTDGLGKDYYVMAYNSDGSTSGPSIASGSTPSQFAIVATEDATEVTINPSTATYRNGTIVQNITLNKGEVYLVQARITSGALFTDLTGSLIRSNKPIAVFAGQQRATVPVDLLSSPSRDCLIEQMIPISSWGKNAIVVPFEVPPDVTPLGNDLVRVLAANDNTKVTIDGADVTINAGKFIEFALTKATFIEANEPILVAQYKKTANSGNDNRSNISDPLMLLVPPVEQYRKSYRVINAQALSTSSFGGLITSYEEQYVTVVGDKLALDNISLNGTTINPNIFTQVPNTPYFYANIRVKDGVNTLSSVGKFAVFVYGYGEANSYGYLGGMGLEVLDLTPPKIYSTIDCYKLKGVATDSSITDSKIATVSQDTSFNDNITLSIEPFTPYVGIVHFDAELKNIYLDGKMRIIATDSSGGKIESIIDLPGFTVAAAPDFSSTMNEVKFEFSVKEQHCFDINLYNYGRFIRNVKDVYFKSYKDEIKRSDVGSFLMQSGEIKPVNFCVYSDEIKELKDTLIITNECGEREVLVVSFVFKSDTLDPRVEVTTDTCNANIRLQFLEDSAFDFGLKAYEIIELENCSITVESFTKTRLAINVSVLDNTKDAFFEITVEDSVGHKTNVRREMPGYTITLSSSNLKYKFNDCTIGGVTCETVTLENYGKFDISLNEASLYRNLLFSIPRSQFPILVPAGKTVTLELCYAPRSSRDSLHFDTLNLSYNCLSKLLPLEGKPLPLDISHDTKCGARISFESDTIRFGMQVNPSLIAGSSQVLVVNLDKLPLKVELYNSIGELVDVLIDEPNPTETIEFIINNDHYANGMYFLSAKIGNRRINNSVFIEK